MASGATGRSFEFLIEPTFLLRRDGDILIANAAARRLLGDGIVGDTLFAHVASQKQAFDRYLQRSTGSTAPLVGSVTLRTATGEVRFRLHCALWPDSSAGTALVLRCLSPTDDPFSIVARKVDELTALLRNRLHENAVLAEALQRNRELLRELQHRVKNNVQMMTSLIQMSSNGNDNEEFARLVERARFRLRAMASAQDAIFRSEQFGTVAAGPLLNELATSIGQSFGVVQNLELRIGDAELSNDVAHALALIVNELLTNAVKYGLPNRHGAIRVSFGAISNGYELVVHDSGPGIAQEAQSRASGLRMVRALCRQIGGAFDIVNENGTRCSVRFSPP